MKNFIVLYLCAAIAIFSLSACNKDSEKQIEANTFQVNGQSYTAEKVSVCFWGEEQVSVSVYSNANDLDAAHVFLLFFNGDKDGPKAGTYTSPDPSAQIQPTYFSGAYYNGSGEYNFAKSGISKVQLNGDTYEITFQGKTDKGTVNGRITGKYIIEDYSNHFSYNNDYYSSKQVIRIMSAAPDSAWVVMGTELINDKIDLTKANIQIVVNQAYNNSFTPGNYTFKTGVQHFDGCVKLNNVAKDYTSGSLKILKSESSSGITYMMSLTYTTAEGNGNAFIRGSWSTNKSGTIYPNINKDYDNLVIALQKMKE